MPIHPWADAPVGLFHHFHQSWTVETCNALNAGLLPGEYYALVEQQAVGLAPDVLALAERGPGTSGGGPAGRTSPGEAVVAERPTARFVAEAGADAYAARANRVAIRSAGGNSWR